jgi:hypothetical protein
LNVTPSDQTLIDISVCDTCHDLRVAVARFQVLTAARMKMTVLWDVAPCNLVNLYLNTGRSTPEDNHLHTCCGSRRERYNLSKVVCNGSEIAVNRVVHTGLVS